ncbi:ABC transporter substrate-binding protein [Pseudorhodoferax sp. Leaf274]|uniref:ABC transporter substrate-binding protein n=1 Tax=Pseudorhodoferax sp. Leaf274 TaxID=1736318 RepID=UPI00070266AA|nr:ABC transporter substrate-binding protein [Pseudorhodoferax sp. Leaf274]KQP45625.1 branched-chain amino acid ABC transporter substrate-binding protein [Pseudorhodoferax sp. Leaf274]
MTSPKHRFSFARGLHDSAAALLGLALACAPAGPAFAQKRYDPGASDTEVRIGHIGPYSGPASAYATIGKAASAYIAKVNAEGGVHGRRIVLLSVDDGYNPAKTVEQARKLVEHDEVLALFAPLGTAQNLAIQRYMNAKKVPQLFVGTGATRFGDAKAFPWTMGWQPTYQDEARIYARHILATRPQARVAVLLQNDDFGRDYLKGFVDALGDRAAAMVVAQASYEVSDATIDSQLIALKASGADVFFNIATPKFAAQAIRKAAETGWRPVQYLASVSIFVQAVLQPAGLDNATGVISASFIRDPDDATLQGTRELADYRAFMRQYYPQGEPGDFLNVLGYSQAQTLVQTIRQAGDELTRENLMRQAANLSMTLPMLYPGIEVKTGPDDYRPIQQVQLVRFNGTRYEALGQPVGK